MRYCAKCNQDKDASAFGKDKHSPDGLLYTCKECRKAAKKSNPGTMRAAREATQKYRANNLEKTRQQDREAQARKRASETTEEYEQRLAGMRDYQRRVKPWIGRKRTPKDTARGSESDSAIPQRPGV